MFISYVHASGATDVAQCLVEKVNDVFLFPLIAFLTALAFLIFLYGAFEYVKNANSEEGRATGQKHLLFGVIGLLVMLSAYSILQIAAGTFGLSTDSGTSCSDSITKNNSADFSNQEFSGANPGSSDSPRDGVSGFTDGPTASGDRAPASSGSLSLSDQLRSEINDRISVEDSALLNGFHNTVNTFCLSRFASRQNCQDAIANLEAKDYISSTLAEQILTENSRLLRQPLVTPDANNVDSLPFVDDSPAVNQNPDTDDSSVNNSVTTVIQSYNSFDNPTNCGADSFCIETTWERDCLARPGNTEFSYNENEELFQCVEIN